MSDMMLGALKIISQKVQVCGIVSNPSDGIASEINGNREEVPDLHIKIWESAKFGSENMPHQKLIVIDGLIAFKGSANLTHWAWRKANDDCEIIEVVSNIEEVIELHNRFFSSIWRKKNSVKKEVISGNNRPLNFENFFEDGDSPF